MRLRALASTRCPALTGCSPALVTLQLLNGDEEVVACPSRGCPVVCHRIVGWLACDGANYLRVLRMGPLDVKRCHYPAWSRALRLHFVHPRNVQGHSSSC